jgi:Family of unknown function (DUF5372)
MEVVGLRRTNHDERVCFYNPQGQLLAIPVTFTSLAAPDPFVLRAAGRSCFRVEDLIELTRLVEGLKKDSGQRCKGNYVKCVKPNTPSADAKSRSD